MIVLDKRFCDGCGACIGVCPEDSLSLKENTIEIRYDTCITCLACVKVCPTRSLFNGTGPDGDGIYYQDFTQTIVFPAPWMKRMVMDKGCE